MTETSISFIEKIIEKTKQNELRWIRYEQGNVELKPDKNNSLTNTALVAMRSALEPTPNKKSSFYAEYKDGFIFLIFYSDPITHSGRITLRAQTKSGDHSKQYASTSGDDKDVVSQLKRLYNIIDASSDDDIDSFVNDFIKN